MSVLAAAVASQAWRSKASRPDRGRTIGPPRDRLLLTATDELTSDGFVSEATWAALSEFSEKQRMDLVLTVGQYTQVAMMLNSFGVQLDPGLDLDPDLDRR